MGRRKYDSKGKIRRKATREEDASWRLTHLLTASHLMAKQVPSLSRFFMRTSSQIGQRINFTMDSMTVKRQVCKKCQTLLIPNGPTPCRIRISSRRETHVVVTCGHCGNLRRYPTRMFDPELEEKRKKKKEESKNIRKREKANLNKKLNNNQKQDDIDQNKRRKLGKAEKKKGNKKYNPSISEHLHSNIPSNSVSNSNLSEKDGTSRCVIQ